jgi:GH15 family glucan-1,4-alpha-glucosidase
MVEVPSKGFQPIENYGVIGDLYTVALVGMDGSIDFLAFPHFRLPTVFAALLDAEKGDGFRLLHGLQDARQKQLYLPDANILLTRFLADEGVAEISDFMPVEEVEQAHNLVRRVKTVRGEICFRILCAPRFDYARASHRVEQREGEVLFISAGNDRTVLRLCTSVPLRIQNGDAIAEFVLRADEYATFVLEWVQPGEESPALVPDYVPRAFKNTVNFWRYWISRSTYQGRWREMVNRSALTLKLLVSTPYGSLVAAPTFGLPEKMGGERNWDYRYTWIRDASFTLYALIRLGYTEEATAFMRWLDKRAGSELTRWVVADYVWH